MMKINLKSRKGQFTIISLIQIIIVLVAFAALNPLLDQVINSVLPNLTTTEQTVILSYKIVILLMILASIVISGTGESERRPIFRR